MAVAVAGSMIIKSFDGSLQMTEFTFNSFRTFHANPEKNILSPMMFVVISMRSDIRISCDTIPYDGKVYDWREWRTSLLLRGNDKWGYCGSYLGDSRYHLFYVMIILFSSYFFLTSLFISCLFWTRLKLPLYSRCLFSLKFDIGKLWLLFFWWFRIMLKYGRSNKTEWVKGNILLM